MTLYEKLMKFIKNEKGDVTYLISLAVGLLIVFVVVQILPVVNSNIASSVTIPTTGAGSEWNSAVHTDLVNASTMWVSTGGIFKVTLIVAIVAVMLAYLFIMIPGGGGGKGGVTGI